MKYRTGFEFNVVGVAILRLADGIDYSGILADVADMVVSKRPNNQIVHHQKSFVRWVCTVLIIANRHSKFSNRNVLLNGASPASIMTGTPTLLRTPADSNEFIFPNGNNFTLPKYISAVSIGKLQTFTADRGLMTYQYNICTFFSTESTVSFHSAESLR